MRVVDTHRDPHARIAFVPTPGAELTIDNLVVRLGSGEPIATVPATNRAAQVAASRCAVFIDATMLRRAHRYHRLFTVLAIGALAPQVA